MKYSVKNFRVFDENGVEMELAPMTIVTGANSAGKSSIAKSFLLLDSFLKQVKEAIIEDAKANAKYRDGKTCINLNKIKLDFTSYPFNLFGSFDNVLNFNTESKCLYFEYTIYSYILSKDVMVQFEFVPDETDLLSGCKLASVEMSVLLEDGGKDYIFVSVSKDSNNHAFNGENLTYCDSTNLCKELLEYAAVEKVLWDLEGEVEDFMIKHNDFEPTFLEDFYINLKETFDNEMSGILSPSQQRINDIWCASRNNSSSIKRALSYMYRAAIVPDNEKREFEQTGATAAMDAIKQTLQGCDVFYSVIAEQLSKFGKDKDAILRFIDEEIYKKMETAPKHNLEIAVKNLINTFITSEYETFTEFYQNAVKYYMLRVEKKAIQSNIESIPQSELLNNYTIAEYNITSGVRTGKLGKDDSGKYHSVFEEKTSEEISQKLNKLDEEFLSCQLGFTDIYHLVMLLEAAYNKGGNYYFYYSSKSSDWGDYLNEMFGYVNRPTYNTYFSAHYTNYILDVVMDKVLKEVLTPDWSGNMSYVSSSRAAEIRRIYPIEAKDEFSKLLRSYVEKGSNAISEDSFINKWVKKFDIADSVSIEVARVEIQPIGIQVILHKANGRHISLADEGFGLSQLLSILLHIEILSKHREKERDGNLSIKYYNSITDEDGFLVDHEVYFAQNDIHHYKPSILILEEPEIHLHPRFQSLLAEMFVDAYKTYNIQFIIETHSEYLIRKLQTLVADIDNKLHVDSQDVSILYVNDLESVSEEGEPHVKQIRIRKNGFLDGKFGKGFFDEATSLTRKIMSL